jgi:hypothetical protein
MANYNTTSMILVWNANRESILTTESRQATMSRPGKLGADFAMTVLL